jgi:hypothetical protein
VRPTSRGPAIAIAMVLAAVLTACSGSPVATPTVTSTLVTDKTTPPDPAVPSGWPLTGVEGEVVERPAVAVKIENTRQARPQTGLEDADVVWETIVEFGVSRFVAIYHSTLPEEVGPIRSVRPVDARIVSPLEGLIAFSGGSPGILRLMRDTPLQFLSEDDDDPGFYRARTRPRPHNVYGSLEEFLDEADEDHSEPPEPQFSFARAPGAATAERHGAPTTRIELALAPGVAPSWSWDADAGRWLRSEASGPAVSADGDRLTATNVLLIEAVSFDSGFDAQQGEPVPDVRLEGEGEGLLATGGRTLPITWSKEDRDEALVLTGPDGRRAALAPGNTWVELIPLPNGSFSLG